MNKYNITFMLATPWALSRTTVSHEVLADSLPEAVATAREQVGRIISPDITVIEAISAGFLG